MECMDITIDKRKTDCHYFDKHNLQIANGDEIIKFINNDGISPFSFAIDIIASSLKLNEQEKNVLYIINYYKENNNINFILDKYKSNYHRSRTTFNRAIETLKNKRVVNVNGAGVIKVNNIYNINTIVNSNARFAIVELYPNVTSKPVTI